MDNTAQSISAPPSVLRYEVLGSRRFSNYWWATIVSIGGLGFFLAGLSSYLRVNLIPFSHPVGLVFIPQGAAIGFYGTAALLLGTYLWLVILWDVGAGFNEFDQANGRVKIFRNGFPGKNRQIEVCCRITDVQSVRMVLREGFNPKRAIYLRIKGRGEIPLTRVGQPMSLSDLENQGAAIASYLGVAIEGL
jgi:Ycf4